MFFSVSSSSCIPDTKVIQGAAVSAFIFPDQFFVCPFGIKIRAFAIAVAGNAAIGRADVVRIFIQHLTWNVAAVGREKINRFAIVGIRIYLGGWIPLGFFFQRFDLFVDSRWQLRFAARGKKKRCHEQRSEKFGDVHICKGTKMMGSCKCGISSSVFCR